ncbi:site-specific DNA-methyltransferase [Thalassotalea psychrophila]|uniref:site-specific DNA-methyltransferase (adenine-specific) n=1 Tax=Thalassotalea psychrophila TaxID=3065647 RepID=A0ABY9TWP0_9GAMM|nr:site-specific DNA-methyltransferase [Colwelliaceae bacterium SQ149]
MPSLEFKGKQFVYSHHLSVPFRELKVEKDKSLPIQGNKASLDDNLIIHGDNLEGLKALLPTHAGKVDCIFIDPPYNTGSEGWCYNDNVRSPLMKEWLKKSANPVDKEDLERHDKWLCMMWPRLQLLKELLAETGSIWITLDDNEMHRLKPILDELFGEHNFISTIIWQKKYSVKSDTKYFSEEHDYMLVYSKNNGDFELHGLPRTESQNSAYKNQDNDPRGDWTSGDLLRMESRDYAIYEIVAPNGKKHLPQKGSSWRFNKDKLEQLIADNRIWFGDDGNSKPRLKRFLSEVQNTIPAQTIWKYNEVGSSDSAKKHLTAMFKDRDLPFATPKPLGLIEKILTVIGNKDITILDSFAGSGTTGHAVIAANKKDKGNRKFILLECEDYANDLTAERIRRSINGYSFKGTYKEEFLKEKISWRSLSKKFQQLLEKVDHIENEQLVNFDKIKKEIKDNFITVTGERKEENTMAGLGGSFTYCTLGDPIQVESLLTGKGMPSFESLAKYVFYTVTGCSIDKVAKASVDGLIGETNSYRIHLFYKPEVNWLRSNEAALNNEKVEAIKASRTKGKRTIVFAVAKFMSQKELTKNRIEFCQLPYAVHKIMGN